ncbi:putative 26S proteasome non-atpase regulatory subunit [Planoprotostelium fungivorum]|uniref:26S proteasome regulatory subunit RPN10 n=1 Tax=Planoprotostelium fungivorum TaxID=1890364 RepID=A0A2P6P000_9EUKA|nr:putative 26S proteasome non-atpase regulatory subunit [Planoprotostelium fungivorum]
MPLEATIVCIDSSDFMRNGDYTPTRLEAQHDAVNLICNAKTQSNPESTVGIIACGGKSPNVLVTLTNDIGKVLTSLYGMKIDGSLSLVNGIQVAQLVLKHRQNKSQQQRIIFFVGSPIVEDKENLVRLGKRLKKNNIAVDIINFGEEAENTDKLEAFMSAVNSDENSHLVTIPPGPHILSDILISSPIVNEGGATGGPSRSGEFDSYGGVDPSLDPELALALKMSMDEERARQEAARNTNKPEGGETAATPAAPAQTFPDDHAMDDDDDELMRQAIAMSMATRDPTPATSTPSQTSAPATTNTTQDVVMGELDEDEEMRLALQMSMAGGDVADMSNVMADPSFVDSVLASLPGVDPNNPEIRRMLQSMSEQQQKEQQDKK